MTSHGIAIGLKGARGFQVTRIAKAPKAPRRAHVQRTLVSEVIKEVVGLAPYEKRVAEFLKNGLDKRALRLASRRLGSHQRGKKKREAIAKYIREEDLARKKAGIVVADKAGPKVAKPKTKKVKVRKTRKPKVAAPAAPEAKK